MSRALAVFVVAGALTSVAHAQTSWANPISGNWSDVLNWSPLNVPDTLGESARFNLAGAYTVSFDVSVNIDDLFVDVSTVTLNINAARSMNLHGPSLNNNGIIALNPQNSSSNASLIIQGTMLLTGTGRIDLLSTGTNSHLTGTGTLIQDTGHTITGTGVISVTLVNSGVVRADFAAALSGTVMTINTAPMVNTNDFVAADGSFLDISVQVDQTFGGRLFADLGEIRLSAATILGGTLEATGPTGRFQINGNTTFENVTNQAEVRVNTARVLTITGTGLTNNGTIEINPTNGASDAFLSYPLSGALTGTGEVRLGGSANNAQITSGVGESISQGANHTVTGRGTINADFSNAGIVAPGLSAGTLTVNRTFENTATGRLNFEVGGLGTTQFDRFIGTAAYTLAGTLNVTIIDGFIPAIGDTFAIIRGISRTGEFDVANLPPPVGGSRWTVGYRTDGVDLVITCSADLTTTVNPNDPAFGVPDGIVDANDFFFYLDRFAAGDLAIADLTGSLDPNNPAFGVPDGVLDGNDFFFYLQLFAAGCI